MAMNDNLRDTAQIYLRVNRKDIAYIANLISTYEGVVLMRTRDPFEAIVEWQVSPDFWDDAMGLIDALKKELSLEIVQWEGNA
jgi:hypothetical protein